MGYYDAEIMHLLNTAMSVFLKDDIKEKHPYLNIENVDPKDAQKRIGSSGKTVFALSKDLVIRDFV